jgi:DNA replication protein DnaC
MVQRGLKNANFRYRASIEQIDYSDGRGLDRNLVQRLSTCNFIEKGEDLFITGSTGTGKSFLASALGQQACLLGYKVMYSNTTKLMSHLKMAKADGAHLRELSKIEKQDALILDDFGVQPFDAGSRALLLDIIEDRHGKRTTIITAQVPVKKWHEVIGEKTLADAIMDRIVHQSIRIELYGDSLRKKQKPATEIMETIL